MRPVAALGALLVAVAVVSAGASAGAQAQRTTIDAGEVHATLVDDAAVVAAPRALAAKAAPAETTTAVQTRLPRARWLALDGRTDDLYPKEFRRLALGRRVEVWVATNLSFPAGDCRNRTDGGTRVRVTPAQATALARAFDTRIYGRFAPVFGTPERRDGRRASGPLGARGTRIVVLVDNVRDDNFYNRDNAGDVPSIAGFYAPVLNDVVDRNVVTLDAYDWTHRIGAAPPHRPSTDACQNAPARPQLYEGVLAHEYHHLLHDGADADEETWLSEGLADYATAVAGYGRARFAIDQIGFASSVQCLLGWSTVATNANPRPRPGGPENSLTVWRDAGDQEILCDYGAAYTFVQFLVDRFGAGVGTSLHRDRRNGLSSVAGALAPGSVAGVLGDWAALLALDGIVDRGTPLATGGPEAVTSRSLGATINWDNPRTHLGRGAPPNGSDYVRLRRADGSYLPASELASLTFTARTPATRRAFGLQIVAYATDPAVPAARIRVPVANGAAAVDTAAFAAIDPRADVVAAIVTYEDVQERISTRGPYELVVNGVLQPGG